MSWAELYLTAFLMRTCYVLTVTRLTPGPYVLSVVSLEICCYFLPKHAQLTTGGLAMICLGAWTRGQFSGQDCSVSQALPRSNGSYLWPWMSSWAGNSGRHGLWGWHCLRGEGRSLGGPWETSERGGAGEARRPDDIRGLQAELLQ